MPQRRAPRVLMSILTHGSWARDSGRNVPTSGRIAGVSTSFIALGRINHTVASDSLAATSATTAERPLFFAASRETSVTQDDPAFGYLADSRILATWSNVDMLAPYRLSQRGSGNIPRRTAKSETQQTMITSQKTQSCQPSIELRKG
jgi:hypothetical protein